jgi:hypothetical protein
MEGKMDNLQHLNIKESGVELEGVRKVLKNNWKNLNRLEYDYFCCKYEAVKYLCLVEWNSRFFKSLLSRSRFWDG